MVVGIDFPIIIAELTNFLQPSSQNLNSKTLWLAQRYISILPKKKSKNPHANNQHHTPHPAIMELMIGYFNITHLYYSSPLTCPRPTTTPSTLDIFHFAP
jgi:hypothetical protein